MRMQGTEKEHLLQQRRLSLMQTKDRYFLLVEAPSFGDVLLKPSLLSFPCSNYVLDLTANF